MELDTVLLWWVTFMLSVANKLIVLSVVILNVVAPSNTPLRMLRYKIGWWNTCQRELITTGFYDSNTKCQATSLLSKSCLKVGLHYGDYRSKLLHFDAQKNIFYVWKSISLERFTP